METKRVTEDFAQRGGDIWALEEISSTMEKIERLFEECDAALGKAGLSSTGYQKQDTATVSDNMASLATYVSRAWEEAYIKLDVPLCKDFANGATHTLSQIKLDEITTKNTFNMEEHKKVYASGRAIYKPKVNKTLTMSDFMGISEMEPGEGVAVLENVESVGWFKDEFRKVYEEQGLSGEQINTLLKLYVDEGSFAHKKRQPGKELLSGLADAVPGIKPAVDAITGKNYITGEELTDFERVMQGTVAVLDIVTLGHGAVALKASGMTGKDIAKTLGKMYLRDSISGIASYTVNSVCDANGMPPGMTFLLTMLTGSKVSEDSGKYFFTDMANGSVREYTLDEAQEILRTGNVNGIVSEGADAAGDVAKIASGGGKEVIEETVESVDDVAKAALEGGLDTYVTPSGGGGITSTIKVNGQTVSFGHGGRHLEGTGLNVNTVNQTLANEVSTLNLRTGQFHKGQIVIGGVTIEYTSYGVSDGIINIGTYYPLE